MPAPSEDFVSEAMPPVIGAVPRTFEPLKNVTVSPLGGVPRVEVTVAVKVTACPAMAGFRLETSGVEVAHVPTHWAGALVLFSSTATEPVVQSSDAHWLATTRSGLPSPFRSATAIDVALYAPELKVATGSNVPSPRPSNTPISPIPQPPTRPQLSTTISSRPSALRSARASSGAAYPPES